MPQKNVVVKKIFEVGDPAVFKQLMADLNMEIGELRTFLNVVMPLVQKSLEEQVFAPMLKDLRTYPPRKLGMKIRWKSDKQRRYVMWLLRSTHNIPYQRTLDLANGWHCLVSINPRSGVISARTWNDAISKTPGSGQQPYMRFIQGDIGTGTSQSSLSRYNKPIQPFHKDRGWQPAQPLIMAAYDKADDFAQESFEAEITKVVQ